MARRKSSRNVLDEWLSYVLYQIHEVSRRIPEVLQALERVSGVPGAMTKKQYEKWYNQIYRAWEILEKVYAEINERRLKVSGLIREK